jgi:hypothetical protein
VLSSLAVICYKAVLHVIPSHTPFCPVAMTYSKNWDFILFIHPLYELFSTQSGLL